MEGKVEPGGNPQVMLSWTIPYFGSNNVNNLEDFAVKGAFVTVSDGLTTDTLKELFPTAGYYYQALHMTGAVGRTYYLTIILNGKTYVSQTTLLNPVSLDSLWNKHEGNDSLGFVWARLSEPAGSGDAYRWYAKRIGKDNDYLAPFGSAFEDKFVEGKQFDFAYDRGSIENSQAEDDNNVERGYFKTGDVVVVKFCHIGMREYRFLRSRDASILSNGNPFAAPSNVESNVTGENVIGLWCGYSPAFDTVTVQ
ncbi:MAG: hypothetical protein K0S33_2326 [Bacteroidetes bacterium]|nr:hypothetical protein [Bacteroidota bacterium]